MYRSPPISHRRGAKVTTGCGISRWRTRRTRRGDAAFCAGKKLALFCGVAAKKASGLPVGAASGSGVTARGDERQKASERERERKKRSFLQKTQIVPAAQHIDQ